MRLKYDKRIWQFVVDAADNIGKEIFTASDIIKKIHEKNPEVPDITIRTFIIAMAPNNPTSHHYPSTRKNHPYLYFLDDGKFRLLKQSDNLQAPPQCKPKPASEKEAFLRENKMRITSWAADHRVELETARKDYGWDYKTKVEAIDERNRVSKDIVLSRIRNRGGVDIETFNQVMDWGGLRHVKLENDQALEITRNAFESLDRGDLKDAVLKLMSIKGVGIASASKLIGLFDQNHFAIYDTAPLQRLARQPDVFCHGHLRDQAEFLKDRGDAQILCSLRRGKFHELPVKE